MIQADLLQLNPYSGYSGYSGYLDACHPDPNNTLPRVVSVLCAFLPLSPLRKLSHTNCKYCFPITWFQLILDNTNTHACENTKGCQNVVAGHICTSARAENRSAASLCFSFPSVRWASAWPTVQRAGLCGSSAPTPRPAKSYGAGRLRTQRRQVHDRDDDRTSGICM